jgi:hypothetical protein
VKRLKIYIYRLEHASRGHGSFVKDENVMVAQALLECVGGDANVAFECAVEFEAEGIMDCAATGVEGSGYSCPRHYAWLFSTGEEIVLDVSKKERLACAARGVDNDGFVSLIVFVCIDEITEKIALFVV